MAGRFPYQHAAYLYRDFSRIEDNAFQQIIRYYEQYVESISYLDEPQQYEMQASYTNALFHVGAYGKFLMNIDPLLECIICDNHHAFQQQDAYTLFLFQKAAALYHCYRYQESCHIWKELLKMYPDSTQYRALLEKCLLKTKQPTTHRFRAASVILVFAAAFITVLELLLIRPFYYSFTHYFEVARWSVLGLGFLVLGFGELRIRFLSHVEVVNFVKSIGKN